MDSKGSSRKEYILKINRVMDYIENHLDQNLSLNVLADIAHFSPFHFHRIFTILTGETLNTYIQRIRMERAAILLQNDIKASVGDIAFQCGFNNASSFGRTFRTYFQMPPKLFRQQERATLVQNGVRYSKNGVLICRNVNKAPNHVTQLIDDALNRVIFTDAKVEIRELPELQIAYVRHTGHFEQLGKAFEKLMSWAVQNGLLNFPQTKMLTVINDDPAITPTEKVRLDVCITVDNKIKAEGEIGKSKLAAGKYAVGHFEISEMEIEKAWNTVSLWLMERNYSLWGKCYQIHYNDHRQHPENKCILDICMPVK